MNLTLYRYPHHDEDGIFGYLITEDGTSLCETLEHSFDGKPAIPPGTYVCQRGTHCLHNGHPFTTFEVTGVPGHTGILLHCGNKNGDSKGCILVGDTWDHADGMILGSRIAFDRFLAFTKNLETFTLRVLE